MLVLFWLILACKPAPDDKIDEEVPLEPLVVLDPVTTLTETVVLGPSLDEPQSLNPVFAEGQAQARGAGLGSWSVGPGEPRSLREDLVTAPVAAGERRSLLMLLHQSDAQLADAESPGRVVQVDLPYETQSAARPQELYAVHALDALLATARAIHEDVPIDFAVATGDNADNCQGNELEWFRDVWDGQIVHADSADPDDQTDDLGHDPLAPFQAAGVPFPWVAVPGNHDVLVQGNFAPDPFADQLLGGSAPAGTRDLSLPGGPLTFRSEPDPARRIVDREAIAEILFDSPASPGPVGHGIAEIPDGTFSFSLRPLPDVPVRLLGVDANPSGFSDGELSMAERDSFLIPALEAAQGAGELVILSSHYALSTLPVEGGGTVGEILDDYENVILVLAGHWHRNLIRPVGPPGDPHGYWEILTASTADWPLQGRLVELVLNPGGTLSIFTTIFDVPAPEGSMMERGRELTAIDLQSGWRLSDGTGGLLDRNTELVQVLPLGFTTAEGAPGIRSESLP
jgi:hypothetical protein